MSDFIDKLYPTSKVGPMIGVADAKDVLRLIHCGKLRAKRQVVRGKGKHPRIVVPLSAIQEYVQSLPDVLPAKSEPPAPKPRRGKLDGVIQFV